MAQDAKIDARARILELRNRHEPGTPARNFLDDMYGLTRSDSEMAHVAADDLLMEYLRASGQGDVADGWEAVSESVGFWYS